MPRRPSRPFSTPSTLSSASSVGWSGPAPGAGRIMADVKRVVVFGTESTGKTRLAQALAVHFGEPWAPEFVRDFWDTHDGKITAADLDAIARGQVANEEQAAMRARRVVF